MQRIVALVALLLFGTAGLAFAANWVEYRPAGIGFRVEMPGNPKISRETGPGGEQPVNAVFADVLSADPQQYRYSFTVIYIEYAPGLLAKAGAERVLDDVKQQAAARGMVSGEKKLKINGHPVRQFSVDDTEHGLISIHRVVVMGDRLIRAVVFGPKISENDPDARRFLNSFTLTGK